MGLVEIRTFSNAFDAHLAKSKLESEGVIAVVFDEYINTVQPLYNMATGGIKLMVRSEDFIRAEALLLEVGNSHYTDEFDQPIQCPSCGSLNVYNGYKSFCSVKGILSIITSFVFFVLPIYYRNSYKCKDCNSEFRLP